MISIPFSGSKRYSYKNVKPIVENGGYHTVYEPFGGSCVLSVNLYNDGIVERAVVNDYDGIFDLYPQYLDYKDWLVEKCLDYGIKRRVECGDYPEIGNTYYYDEKHIRHPISVTLNHDERAYLQSLIAQIPRVYWKLLTTGSNFTHSAKGSDSKIELSDFRYFRNYIYTDKQHAYLEVVNKMERVKLDYKEFLETMIGNEGIIIADPPYCDASQGQYKTQFTEEQTVELLKLLKNTGLDFIFFNHNMGKILNWCEIAGINYTSIEYTGNALKTANRKRKDVMLYVKNSELSRN